MDCCAIVTTFANAGTGCSNKTLDDRSGAAHEGLKPFMKGCIVL